MLKFIILKSNPILPDTMKKGLTISTTANSSLKLKSTKVDYKTEFSPEFVFEVKKKSTIRESLILPAPRICKSKNFTIEEKLRHRLEE